jgi:hypothetical protein
MRLGRTGWKGEKSLYFPGIETLLSSPYEVPALHLASGEDGAKQLARMKLIWLNAMGGYGTLWKYVHTLKDGLGRDTQTHR